MQYHGKFPIFDSNQIKTYPVADRINKVQLEDLADPERTLAAAIPLAPEQEDVLDQLAKHIVLAVRAGRPVIWFTGAHLIKNGLGLILIDLIRRGAVSLLGTNGAGTIHDFELALIGQTSEYVPNALPQGQFGMAREFGYINAALLEGQHRLIGFGQALGQLICDSDFRRAVEKRLNLDHPIVFKHPEVSLIAACHQHNIPLTVHVGIGTDVIDQHPNFDGSAKGGCSGRDFLIYTQHVTNLDKGGVVLNIGSAVTGPEVLLKAVSMAGNINRPPCRIVTADFDLKPYHLNAMNDESNCCYYFRHHKSVATRIPAAFQGQGLYIQGDQCRTVPRLYQLIIQQL